MNFDFSDEQYMFRDSVRDTLAAEYPIEALRDGDDVALLDVALWPKLAELGLFGLLVPEDHGGLGLAMVDFALIVEEFGAGLVPMSVTDTMATGAVIGRFGSAAQKKALLGPLAEGALRIACAVYETGGGYDITNCGCTLTREDNVWRLDGAKIMVAAADNADRIAVVAKRPDGSLALVLVKPGDLGVSVTDHVTLDLSGRYHQVVLSGVSVTDDDIVDGDEAATALVEMLTTIGALELTGIASRLLDTTVEYVKQRVQFGQPIGAFQAIKHRCADLAVAINTSRSGGYFAAWALASDAAEKRRAISMAKAYANDMAVFAGREAIQLHGGMGFTWDMALHFYTRRAKLLETLYGSADYHREIVMAETLTAMADAD